MPCVGERHPVGNALIFRENLREPGKFVLSVSHPDCLVHLSWMFLLQS